MIKNEVINLSHCDLDGVGCNISLYPAFGYTKAYHTNYQNIQKYLKILKQGAITYFTEKVFITDLNFSKEDLDVLEEIVRLFPKTQFIYIDHHEYEEQTFEKLKALSNLPNFILIHSKKYSATLLTFKFIKKYIKKHHISYDPEHFKNIEKLVNIINDLDIWNVQGDYFKNGFFLNTIFWNVGINKFKSSIVNNGFKIPTRFKKDYSIIVKNKNIHFKELEENSLIKQNSGLFVGFVMNYIEFIQFHYPDNKFYIIINLPQKNFSFRMSEEYGKAEKLRTEVINFMQSYPRTISVGGHMFAFGASLDKETPEEDIFALVEGCIKIFEKVDGETHV